MTLCDPGFSIERLTLPHEDAAENRRFYDYWIAAFPSRDPIVRGFVQQAVVAQLEKRRLERVRAALRTERVRTAVLYYERDQEDEVIRCIHEAGESVPDAMRHMLRSAAGCRWAIGHWERLKTKLTDDGTWYGADRIYAIQLQGLSACLDQLSFEEEAYTTWLDCLVAQPNPKQPDIDLILERRHVPKSIQDRDVKLWPGNPEESRARLWEIVNRELPPLKELEKTLRETYEEPALAAAEDMALARVTKEEMALLRAERTHEQSYAQAVRALQRFHKPSRPAEPEIVARRAWHVEREEGREGPGPRYDVVPPSPRAPDPDPQRLASHF
jgi:hypothetical protein